MRKVQRKPRNNLGFKNIVSSNFGLGITKINKIRRHLGVRSFKKQTSFFLERILGFIKLKFVVRVGIKWKDRYEAERNSLKLSGCLRHFRFIHGLPCRGQRTQTNGRTAKRIRGIVRRKFSNRQVARIRQKKSISDRYTMRKRAQVESRIRTTRLVRFFATRKRKVVNYHGTRVGIKRFKTTISIIKAIAKRIVEKQRAYGLRQVYKEQGGEVCKRWVKKNNINLIFRKNSGLNSLKAG